MAETSSTNQEKKISRSTANHFIRLLVTALRHGASMDLCTNPLEDLELVEPKGNEIRKRRRAMSQEEYGRFVASSIKRDELLAAADPGRIPQTPTYLALYEAGRRREEIAALEWPAVHLEGDSPTWEFHETKGSKLSATDDGPERYAIPPRLLPYLVAMRRLHERRLGRPVGDGDRVFLSSGGRPVHGDNLRRGFYRLLQLAGIPRGDHRGRTLDLHAARTTVYARGAAAGIPVDQMMAFVGHRDIRTAMKHYRDPNASNTQAIAAKLAGVPEACGVRGGAHGEAASASLAAEHDHSTERTGPGVRTGIRAASSTAAHPQANRT